MKKGVEEVPARSLKLPPIHMPDIQLAPCGKGIPEPAAGTRAGPPLAGQQSTGCKRRPNRRTT
jgi:hypothetical protein